MYYYYLFMNHKFCKIKQTSGKLVSIKVTKYKYMFSDIYINTCFSQIFWFLRSIKSNDQQQPPFNPLFSRSTHFHSWFFLLICLQKLKIYVSSRCLVAQLELKALSRWKYSPRANNPRAACRVVKILCICCNVSCLKWSA